MTVAYRINDEKVQKRLGLPQNGTHYYGIACETERHFVHFTIPGDGLWRHDRQVIHCPRRGTPLNKWIRRTLKPDGTHASFLLTGEVVLSVWRPGILDRDDALLALRPGLDELDADLQTAQALLFQLTEILKRLGPRGSGPEGCGQEIRTLIRLAGHELIQHWKRYLWAGGVAPGKHGYTMRDYARLAAPLYLGEYQFHFKRAPDLGLSTSPLRPFQGWGVERPIPPRPWYGAWIKILEADQDQSAGAGLTDVSLSEPSLASPSLADAIEALCAFLTMISVRYSPHVLTDRDSIMQGLFNSLFELSLFEPDPSSFYTPLMEIDQGGEELPSTPDGTLRRAPLPWRPLPFVL